MKLAACHLASILVIVGLSTAQARPSDILDLNTVKCQEWINGNEESIGYTMAWMDGYYKDENDAPVINFDNMKKNATKLAKYCEQNPNLGLGTAAEQLFGN
jgi:acid stress chaperone HdeB